MFCGRQFFRFTVSKISQSDCGQIIFDKFRGQFVFNFVLSQHHHNAQTSLHSIWFLAQFQLISGIKWIFNLFVSNILRFWNWKSVRFFLDISSAFFHQCRKTYFLNYPQFGKISHVKSDLNCSLWIKFQMQSSFSQAFLSDLTELEVDLYSLSRKCCSFSGVYISSQGSAILKMVL